MLSREHALERLSTTKFDLLVVGGGITGAGIALDASTRGLSVALVDKADFASGTSSKSSKLIHGGLRYLEHREFGLMQEACSERDLLRGIAPHLVTPLPFLWASWAGAGRQAAAGLWVYDVLAAFRNVKRHKRVSAEKAAELLPGTRKSGGGFLFYDSQTDDTRLTLAVLNAATKAGAVVCNHLRAENLLEVSGGVVGAGVRDEVGGGVFEVRAGDVVNATGVWADDLRLVEDPDAERRLRPSKGIHIVLPRSVLPMKVGALIPTKDKRLIFVLPWRSSTVVGTSDTEYTGSLENPSVTSEEVDYMLGALSYSFDQEFRPDQIVGAYAGLRPLLSGSGTEKTKDLSRRHAVFRGPKGMVTITGGKLTTYRSMAEEAVDLLTRRRGRYVRSVTKSIRLGITNPETVKRSVKDQTEAMGLSRHVADSLVRSYGDDAPKILKLAEEMELTNPVVDGLPYLEAELVWGIRRELASRVDDLMERRTRLSLEDPSGGLTDRSRIASIISTELAGSPADIEAQMADYEHNLTAERGPSVGLAPSRS